MKTTCSVFLLAEVTKTKAHLLIANRDPSVSVVSGKTLFHCQQFFRISYGIVEEVAISKISTCYEMDKKKCGRQMQLISGRIIINLHFLVSSVLSFVGLKTTNLTHLSPPS